MNDVYEEILARAHDETFAFGSRPGITIPVDTLAKFAELIVRECADIMDKDADHPYNSRGSILKYHFGVEE